MGLDADDPPLDSADFVRRWERARLAAIRKADTEAPGPSAHPVPEAERLERLLAAAAEPLPEFERRKVALLRAVFENSRRLGLSLSRHLALTFEIEDFKSIMAETGVPCWQGTWERRDKALILERKGCEAGQGAGTHACDYWREALDGLVMGLGDKERLARHACLRHGDESCVDVLFTESPGGTGSPEAWAPVPEHMALDLHEAAEYFRRKTGVSVAMKGVNEGTLHFEFLCATDGGCGSAPASLFGDLVRERFPGLAVKDVTPQAVMGEQGG